MGTLPKTSNSEFLTEIFKKLSDATESDHSSTLGFWEIFLEYFNFWKKKIKKLWKQSIYTTINCYKFLSKITKIEKCMDCVSTKFSYIFLMGKHRNPTLLFSVWIWNKVF